MSLVLQLETPSQPLHSLTDGHLVPFPSGQASTTRPALALLTTFNLQKSNTTLTLPFLLLLAALVLASASALDFVS